MNKSLPETVKATVVIFAVTAIFLLVIATHDRETMAEYRHAADSSHDEESKPPGYGR